MLDLWPTSGHLVHPLLWITDQSKIYATKYMAHKFGTGVCAVTWTSNQCNDDSGALWQQILPNYFFLKFLNGQGLKLISKPNAFTSPPSFATYNSKSLLYTFPNKIQIWGPVLDFPISWYFFNQQSLWQCPG